MNAVCRTLVLMLIAAALAAADDSTVIAAMKDEMARSLEQLRFPGMERPYYLAYRLRESRRNTVRAMFGSAAENSENASRSLDVEMRVGDTALDNAHFFSSSSDNATVISQGSVPLDDDYAELRRSLWLATDRAYKKVTDDFTRKKTALTNRRLAVTLPDFRTAPAVTVVNRSPMPAPDTAAMEKLVCAMSARFRSTPLVQYSEVQLSYERTRSLFLNSDGTTDRADQPFAALSVYAGARLPDGAPVQDYLVWYASTPDSLPGADSLVRAVDMLGKVVAGLSRAPVLQRYVGPVLFEDEAAAELFTRFMVPALCGWRKPVVEDQRYQQYFDAHPLVDKIGGRVLPEHMGVADDPTIKTYNGRALLGYGEVDDDGVRTRRKELVRDGLLRNLLTMRAPVQGIDSTGGNRWGRTAMPSNLLVTTRSGITGKDIKRRLIDLVKRRHLPHGIIIRRIGNPFYSQYAQDKSVTGLSQTNYTPRLRSVIEAYQVFADGSEKPVRCPNLSGLSVESFKYIVAVSRDYHLENLPIAGSEVYPFGYGGSQIFSISVPDMLFEDVTLKAAEEIPAPWVGRHPYFLDGK